MAEQRLTKLFLARHGESMANQQKRVSGQIDTPLSPKGKQQALWLCDVLKDEPIGAIFTSSLNRTIETARPAAHHHGLEIQVLDGFKEMNFGALQGRKHQQLSYDQAIARRQTIKTEAHGTEIPDAFNLRIKEALQAVLHGVSSTVLIVGHRKTNEVILARLLNADLTHVLGRPINIKNKYLYEIELGQSPRVNTIRLGGDCHGQRFSGIKDD